jgi:hypothetical protein
MEIPRVQVNPSLADFATGNEEIADLQSLKPAIEAIPAEDQASPSRKGKLVFTSETISRERWSILLSN